MEAKDLSIGNLVRCLTSENEFSQIVAISEEVPSIDEITFDYLSYDEIEPIPLNEEWLLKFGFKKNINHHHWENYSSVSIYKIGDCFMGNYNNNLIIEIKHVHQFQNLYFALTGEELINNDL